MPRNSQNVEAIVEAMSIKYNTMVYELKDRGVDVTVLSLGEAYFDIPLRPFDDLPIPAIYHYSHSRGIPELRRNIADYFREEYSFRFDPESDIIVTAGSKIAIHMAFMTMLNPGDEVIIQEPAWVSYPEQVKLCHGVPVMLRYQETVFDYAKHITPKTRCIIINSPHNPTGKVYARAELEHLLQLAREHDFFILSDEAYSDFLLNEDRFVSLGLLDPELEHSVVCNSISKNYGISGWRVGYVISNPSFIDQLLKVQQHLVTCAPTILQYYIARHFREVIDITKPQIMGVVMKRKRLAEYMDKIGLEYMPGTATFYFMVSIAASRLASEEFCTRLLMKHHISTVPGLGYGHSCDRHIRVSVGTETWERTTRGIDTIKKLIEETR